jgi:hypothetical protein
MRQYCDEKLTCEMFHERKCNTDVVEPNIGGCLVVANLKKAMSEKEGVVIKPPKEIFISDVGAAGLDNRDYAVVDAHRKSDDWMKHRYLNASTLRDLPEETLRELGVMRVPDEVQKAIKKYADFMDGDTCHDMLHAIQDWVNPIDPPDGDYDKQRNNPKEKP